MNKRAQRLNFTQAGADDGRMVVYFHGVPGAPEECRIFDMSARHHGLTFICIDRFSVDPSICGETYYRILAEAIEKNATGKKVDVIGFSIGAFVALKTCRYLMNNVKSLHLVSAAAPLETGDYLGEMAGKRVFAFARKFPFFFLLLSYCERWLALLFPDVLFRWLFASAVGGDTVLAKDREFQTRFTKVLKSCFIGRTRGYARDIENYVRPWKTTLSDISVETHIGHGTEDNWSPRRMAEFLKSAIPGCTSARIFDGLSHYSCLYRAAPEICDLLGKAKDCGGGRHPPSHSSPGRNP